MSSNSLAPLAPPAPAAPARPPADGAANEVIAFNLATELSVHHCGRERLLFLAVLGCLIAGVVGIIKASIMAKGLDVLLCLWGSVLAFAVAIGVYLWKHTSHSSDVKKKSTRAVIRRAPINGRFRVAVRPERLPDCFSC